MYKQSNNEACIVELDIVGFTTRYKNAGEQREILRIFQDLLEKSGEFITPHSSFSNKYHLHGTGDGYYIILDEIHPVVALQFVWLLMEKLDRYNESFGSNLPLQLRCVLGYGKVELVGNQLFSAVLSDAERLISDSNFKEYQAKSGKNSVLFLTNLFYFKLMQDIQTDKKFSHLHGLTWTRVQVRKDKNIHIGYLLGKYGRYVNLMKIPFHSLPLWKKSSLENIKRWENRPRNLVTNTILAYRSKPGVIKDMCKAILEKWQTEITKPIHTFGRKIDPHYGDHICLSMGHPDLKQLARQTALKIKTAKSESPGLIPEHLVEIVDQLVGENKFPVWDSDSETLHA